MRGPEFSPDRYVRAARRPDQPILLKKPINAADWEMIGFRHERRA
jgi:hypothetical protein